MSEKTVKLIENFSSYQGEGPDCGRAMIILRFKTCNLNCPWCDTSVKMRISAESPHRLSDIQKTIDRTRSGILVTGGEPTVPKHIDEAAILLNDLVYPIANVETNGFQLQKLIKKTSSSKNIHFIYSPKFFDENDLNEAMKKTVGLLQVQSVYIKIVYHGDELTDKYCQWLSQNIGYSPWWTNRVWLMPEGVTRADLIRNSSMVFDACEKYRFNFSTRSHIIYGFI